MTSKELFEDLILYLNATEPSGRFLEHVETIKEDLETLENIKSKTLLFYSDRKKIAEEYAKWCKENNVMITDTTNMITWLLCIKLKEWLEK